MQKVSVVIPCHNAERWIGATLESVFAQTWRNLEVIVVDDGSTDRSPTVVEGLARNNLTLIRQEKRGAAAARNVGLASAAGDFVQLLDADDLIDPDKIALQMARLDGHSRSIASARWARFRDRPEDARFVDEPVGRDLDPIDWLALSRAEGLGMMFPALWLMPMAIVRSVGPWREDLSLADDTEYFTRVVLAADRILFERDARAKLYHALVARRIAGFNPPTSGGYRVLLTVLVGRVVGFHLRGQVRSADEEVTAQLVRKVQIACPVGSYGCILHADAANHRIDARAERPGKSGEQGERGELPSR